jgi:hypothetical protein
LLARREGGAGGAGDAAPEQRGTDEKQRGTKSSRGWWPGGAGDTAPAEEGRCQAAVVVRRHHGRALQLQVSSNPRAPSHESTFIPTTAAERAKPRGSQIDSRHRYRARQAEKNSRAASISCPGPRKWLDSAPPPRCFRAASPASALLPRRLPCLGARGRFGAAYGRERGASPPLRAEASAEERFFSRVFALYSEQNLCFNL